MDLFVSNDTDPNYIFVDRGNGRFDEVGFQAGVAYSDAGRTRSSIGVDCADNDGRMDLFVGNIDHDYAALYHNDGDISFSDRAGEDEIATATSTQRLGTKFL
jgi:hypothetical protein